MAFSSSLARPFLRAVLDEENLNMDVSDTVGDDVWRSRDHQLARADDLSGAADEGVGRQEPVRFGINRVDDAGGALGAALGDVVADGFKLA